MKHATIHLVMTTHNRHACVRRLLDSLVQQRKQNFCLLAGLQEPDEEMLQLVEHYQQQLPISVHSFECCGLSAARNRLLPFLPAEAEIVALTDDDCWYPEDFTQALADFFEHNPSVDACIGTASERADASGNREVSSFSIFSRAPSWLLFFRASAFRLAGRFDEELGIGARTPWQSGEETDFALRLLSLGKTIVRTGTIRVMHPQLQPGDRRKWYGYGLGRMRVLKKHRMPLWFCLLNVLYPLVKIVRVSPRFWPCYFAMFRARLKGLFCSRP